MGKERTIIDAIASSTGATVTETAPQEKKGGGISVIVLVVSGLLILALVMNSLSQVTSSDWREFMHGFFIFIIVVAAMAFVGFIVQTVAKHMIDRRFQREEERENEASRERRAAQDAITNQAALAQIERAQVESDAIRAQTERDRMQMDFFLVPEGNNVLNIRTGQMYLFSQARHQVAQLAQQNIPQIEAPKEALPTAPAWQQMKHLIRPGQLILGYGVNGPIYGDVPDLLSTGVMGLPKSGKSTTLFYLIAQLLCNNMQVVCWDPHNGLIRLASYINIIDLDDMPNHAAIMQKELRKRLAEQKQNNQQGIPYNPQPLVLVVDEIPVISDRFKSSDPDVMTTIRNIVLEGRKVNFTVIMAGQSFAAKQFDGSMLKNNLYVRYVLDSEQLEAQMAGLNISQGNEIGTMNRGFLRAIRGQRGMAILDWRKSGVVPQIVAIPETTVNDIAQIISRNAIPRQAALPPLPERAPQPVMPLVNSNNESAEQGIPTWKQQEINKRKRELAKIPNGDYEAIKEHYLAGTPRRNIPSKLGKGNGYYWAVMAVCDDIDEENNKVG